MVLLTVTMGRPEESNPRVIAVRAQMVAAVNGRHESDAGQYNHVDRPDLVANYVRHVAFRHPLTTVFVAAHKAEPRRG